MKTTLGNLKSGEKAVLCRTGQVLRILIQGKTNANVCLTRTKKTQLIDNRCQVEKIEHFFFTFPGNSKLKCCYFIEYGTFEATRTRAKKHYGNDWSMQYDGDTFRRVREDNKLILLDKKSTCQ